MRMVVNRALPASPFVVTGSRRKVAPLSASLPLSIATGMRVALPIRTVGRTAKAA